MTTIQDRLRAVQATCEEFGDGARPTHTLVRDSADRIDALEKALREARTHHFAALCVVRGNLDESYAGMANEMEQACARMDAALGEEE